MEEDRRKSVFYVLCFVLVVCLYQVVYGRLMDAKTRPLFGLYRLRFIHYQKVFIPALMMVRYMYESNTVRAVYFTVSHDVVLETRKAKLFAILLYALFRQTMYMYDLQ